MKYLLTLSAALCCLSQTPSAMADEIRYEWDAVPNTSYYIGTVKRPDGDVAQFRTQSTWLLFEEGSAVTLESYGSDDEPIGPVKLRGNSPLTPPPAVPPAASPVESEPDIEAEIPAPASSEESQPEPEAEEAPPDLTPRGPRELGHVALHLGIGKEWLNAHGGISAYEGSTNIGGTSVSAESQGPGSSWFFSGDLHAHNYSTLTKEKQSTGGSSSETESKFLRLTVRAAAFYDFNFANPNYRLGAGLGFAYFRMPVLVLENDSTGATELQNRAGMGPYLGVSYQRYLSSLHTFGAEFDYLPSTLSNDAKGNGTKLLLSWRYSFVQDLFSDVGITSERTSLAVKVDCPSVTGCDDASKSSSNLIQALMGIGYRW